MERMRRDIPKKFSKVGMRWKKVHGLKWQTVILANGMDFDVWDPVSARQPDAFTLNYSRILDKVEQLQEGQRYKYKMFGDSLYVDGNFLVTGGGKGMSAVRESIEWSYKDFKTYWKHCDYRHCLQLRKQSLAKIFFVCRMLRKTHSGWFPKVFVTR